VGKLTSFENRMASSLKNRDYCQQRRPSTRVVVVMVRREDKGFRICIWKLAFDLHLKSHTVDVDFSK
jgi:hypothetical protein